MEHLDRNGEVRLDGMPGKLWRVIVLRLHELRDFDHSNVLAGQDPVHEAKPYQQICEFVRREPYCLRQLVDGQTVSRPLSVQRVDDLAGFAAYAAWERKSPIDPVRLRPRPAKSVETPVWKVSKRFAAKVQRFSSHGSDPRPVRTHRLSLAAASVAAVSISRSPRRRVPHPRLAALLASFRFLLIAASASAADFNGRPLLGSN
ncbi:hypothetical protein NKJ55_32010 [Mesorhizobium sp. M0106]|uniref:hypothetical protein n=1 Tax=Mesorhizobium sp. M0106 TaxID=2956880 RepID=UPI003335EFA1